jgi:hypothetical protein
MFQTARAQDRYDYALGTLQKAPVDVILVYFLWQAEDCTSGGIRAHFGVSENRIDNASLGYFSFSPRKFCYNPAATPHVHAHMTGRPANQLRRYSVLVPNM